jgi:anti-sigma factor RsiW
MAAFVDGELDHVARDRALAHLSHCPGCRLAVEQERWIKDRLQALPVGEPSASLLGSLFATAGVPPSLPATAAPTLGRATRSGLALAGVGSVSAMMFGVAYLLGGAGPSSDPSAPAVSPPVDQFSVQFAGTTEGSPFSDPGFGVLPAAVERPALPVATR